MQLLLLKRGGQVIYSGPLGRNSHKVVEYFQVCDLISEVLLIIHTTFHFLFCCGSTL
jgi:hypothetical protein